MTMTLPHAIRKADGFTLIEVLVAIVVLATGLLGLAGLQVWGVRNTNNAYLRSQATLLANDMAERMRANAIGAYDFTSDITGATYTNAYAAIDSDDIDCAVPPAPYCAAYISPVSTTQVVANVESCTPAQMATFDTFIVACGHRLEDEYKGGLDDLLPNGRMTITCNDVDAGDPGADTLACTFNPARQLVSTHTITVTWQELERGNDGATLPETKGITFEFAQKPYEPYQ